MRTSAFSKFGIGTIWELFLETTSALEQKDAIIYLGEKYTFGELRLLVERLAKSLLELGVREGERIIIYMSNCPQWVIAWLAAIRLKCIAVPISPIYTPMDLEYMSNDSEAETIFCMDTNFGYVAEVKRRTCLKRVIVTTLVDLLPWWKKAFGRAFNRVPKGRVRYEKGVVPFTELVRRKNEGLPPYSGSGDQIFEMLYTGGTTGAPKGVPFTHLCFIESITEQRAQTEMYIPKGSDVVVQGGPLFHILGQAVGLGGLLWGDTVILLPRVSVDAILYHIQKYKAKSFFGVPALYRMILEHDRVDYYDLGSLQYCFSGGDVLPGEVAERWEKKFGVPIYQGYGTTETCGRVALTPMGARAPAGSAGKVVPSQRVLVVDPDTLEPVPDGEPGELLVSSEYMVKGYWKKEEETRECFVWIGGRLWYRTRDIVRIDSDGWLYFLDRSADIIKHKGYRIAASEIEGVLQEHPCVVAACVVGVPDEMVGERIKAFVVLKEDAKGVSAQDLIKWCKERLAPYKIPQYIEFRDMLPKSKVGKTLRRQLREEERKKREKGDKGKGAV